MAKKNNLIPLSERDPDETSRITHMGGLASGVARREKRKTLDMLELVLNSKIKVDGKMMSKEQAYMIACLRRGLATGNVDLMELIAKLRGELVQKVETEVNGSIPCVLTDVVEEEEKPKRGKQKA